MEVTKHRVVKDFFTVQSDSDLQEVIALGQEILAERASRPKKRQRLSVATRFMRDGVRWREEDDHE